MSITVEQFIERLTQSGLMSAAEVSTFQDGLPPDKRPKDVQQLARALVQHGKLTKYQAQAVYEGKTKGLVFGEYVVLDKLGEGGMGVVLKAQHRRMKRLVAVKMIAGKAIGSPDAVQRFYREVEAAAKLNHPNIVQAHDASEHEGSHYLVMEYVEGRDLAAIVRDRGPMAVRAAVEYVLQAARGFQYAHEQGIVHRDIKPSNLLLDKKGTVKILDMGLARIIALADDSEKDRLTGSSQVMGTCDYMAPEQAMDTHHADARADIYSLGCTLYRLLTGHVPYQGQALAQILMAHQQAPIPSLSAARPDVPAELDSLFQKMMAKRPEDRFQSMAEVVAELEAVLVVSSGPSRTAAAKAGSPREALNKTLTFQQGENRLGRARRAIDKIRQMPLVLAGPVGGLVVLLGIVLAVVGLDRKRKLSLSAPPPAVAPFDEKKAKEHQGAWAKYLGVPVEITNSIGMKLVLIPPGEFMMGSPKELIEEELKVYANANDTWYQNYKERLLGEGPQHRVRITNPFYLGMYVVTQEEYQRVMGNNPSCFSATGGDKDKVASQDTKRFPVVYVFWGDAVEFCRKLSEIPEEKAAGRTYLLPSEAQWEYACRAGSTGRYSFSSGRNVNAKASEEKTLSDYGWFSDDSGGVPHAVGLKGASAWGLSDMHGNVWEWCRDWYDKGYYAKSPTDDPTGPLEGANRVFRGGTWNDPAWGCRSAYRGGREPGNRHGNVGFRVSLVLADK
jgi:serine/threonine-protein kinase